MKKYAAIILLLSAVALVPCLSDAGNVTTNTGQVITLPHTETFDGTGWTADGLLTSDECGGTARRDTSGCYAGAGCLKVIPPTSACTGGGINGGAVGMGWYTYGTVANFHVRFLIKFGSAYYSGIADGGGGLINKFLLQDAPARTGILGFNADGATSYAAFGITSDASVYVYRTPPNRGWIQDALFKVSATEHVNEWIAVEYFINQSTSETGLYIWTQDAEFNGIAIEGVTPLDTGNQTGFYFNYFNCYGTANANNYYMIDDLVVSNTYIGPPDGFVGGGGGSSTFSPGAGSVACGGGSGSLTLN